MPHAEQLIWAKLKGRQVENCKFRRQYSVGAFVIDFYTTEVKLAIEIDGSSHDYDGSEIYDPERQLSIESYGIKFLRFTNQQVYEELDAVIEAISRTICALRELTHPSPPPIEGSEAESPPFIMGGWGGKPTPAQSRKPGDRS